MVFGIRRDRKTYRKYLKKGRILLKTKKTKKFVEQMYETKKEQNAFVEGAEFGMKAREDDFRRQLYNPKKIK